MLKSIASQGISPLSAYWAKKSNTLNVDELSTIELIDYFKSVTKTQEQEHKGFEAHESEQSYTWPWKTLCALRKELDSLTGLATIALDGCNGDELLVEFTKDKVTVATIWDTPEINCKEFNREEWADRLLELITGREPHIWRQVFLFKATQTTESPWYSSVSISLLK